MQLSIMGIQGCGKGTQSKRLVEKYKIKHLSTGDLFRAHIQNNTETGKKIKQYLNDGELVPDSIVFDVLEKEIDGKGFILDGFPRNVSQAKYLLSKYPLDKVIYLNLDKDLAVARISARQRCENCNIDYSLINKPKKENICNKCSSALSRRADDEPDTVNIRLSKYFEKTMVLTDFFKKKGLLLSVDANQSPDLIFEQIIKGL